MSVLCTSAWVLLTISCPTSQDAVLPKVTKSEGTDDNDPRFVTRYASGAASEAYRAGFLQGTSHVYHLLSSLDPSLLGSINGRPFPSLSPGSNPRPPDLSRPPSLDLSRPPSLDLSRPPSLDLSRPPSLDLSRPPSLDLSRPPSLDLSRPPSLDLSRPPSLDLSRPPSLDLSRPTTFLNYPSSSTHHIRPPIQLPLQDSHRPGSPYPPYASIVTPPDGDKGEAFESGRRQGYEEGVRIGALTAYRDASRAIKSAYDQGRREGCRGPYNLPENPLDGPDRPFNGPDRPFNGPDLPFNGPTRPSKSHALDLDPRNSKNRKEEGEGKTEEKAKASRIVFSYG